ncbi:MAG: family 20 glycosylhydrolase [Fimbriimonas sp.]
MTATFLFLALITPHAPKVAVPPLVPMPRSVAMRAGVLQLAGSRIVYDAPSLASAAKVLADAIFRKTGAKLAVGPGKGAVGIRLQTTQGGKPESYRLEIGGSAVLTASSQKGFAWGTATLLQAIQGKARVPHMTVVDEPLRPYRGLLIDVARQYHSIPVLKQCVELCAFYKIGYLQLHLTDDQSFMFPSKSLPLSATQNQHGGATYTVAELRQLVEFANVRGVTIIPEIDLPGHSAALIRAMPDLFKIKGTKPYEHHATINFANPKVLEAVDTLVGEVCDVFSSSPYFHMGGDEADITYADQHPDFQAAFREHGLPNGSQQEIFRRFLTQVNEMAKKRGKKLIVWEGFGRDPGSKFPIPSDVLVMPFENSYYLPGDLLADGYTVINASWTPLYVVKRHVWPAQKVYDWNIDKFGRFSDLYPKPDSFLVTKLSDQILGAQVCSWEGPEASEVENLRRIVPALAERLWSDPKSDFSDFARRLAVQDIDLGKLVWPVSIQNSRLDGTDPSGFDVPCFTKPLTVTLSGPIGVDVRYTLDGSPVTDQSQLYALPLNLTQTTTIRAATFSKAGVRSEYESAKTFYFVPEKRPNLATGKKVTSSAGTQHPQDPELVVDDSMDLHSSWWAGPAPQWIQVDLGKSEQVDRIEVFPYWDGSRYYQYTVEVSPDGQKWSVVADRSTNTVPASSSGDEIRLAARPVRFVRVNMTKNSANESVHLVELKVWGPGRQR